MSSILQPADVEAKNDPLPGWEKNHFHEGREDTKTQKRKSKRVFSAISAISAISAVKIFSEIFAQNDSFARKTLSKAPYRWRDVFFPRDL